MKLWAYALVLLLAGWSLVACGGASAAAAKSCARSVANLDKTMRAHPRVRAPQVGDAARISFTHCGSVAFWTVPAKHDALAKLVSKHASLHEDLWTICNRYDPDFVTPVCEDRHENG